VRITTCKANDLVELMAKIRDEHGPDAVLLAVRRVPGNSGNERDPFILEGTVGHGPVPKKDLPVPEKESGKPKAAMSPAQNPLAEYLAQREDSALEREKEVPNDAPVIALMGPMSSGKTTTAAKLAGRLATKSGKPTGVLSTDTERPGGAGLLMGYASALRLHATTAASAFDLRDRLARWNCRGPLVIDTRGCGPRDNWAIERLGSLLDSAGGCEERYLVLSATAHPAMARECLEAYSTIGVKGVVLTRVDQATGIGHCLDEIRRRDVPIVFLGTGDRVPDDLAEPSSANLRALRTARRNLIPA
jgi:flagellar biosynthesis protein FlhF